MRNQVSSNETPESQEKENFDFIQMSRGYLKQMRNLARKSPIAHEILYYLVEHMGRTTNAVVVSYATLCEITGVSRPTVARAVRLLKDLNWVDAVKVGSATAYCVNAKVFWQAARNQKKYAIFQATVIAAETEQESSYPEKYKEDLTYIPVIGKNEKPVISDEKLPPPDQGDLNI
jgi:Fe2+ or Zn2+ uptake regulation protein